MRVLYICTHNRCRSILSEAITNQLGGGSLRAASAGSQPVGEVHPLSLKYLQERGYQIEGLQSQSWNDLESFGPDLVITVCDSAANEACPLWFDKTTTLHWGLEDPSKIDGTEEEIKQAFYHTIDTIETRVKQLLKLADENLSATDLRDAVTQLSKET